MNNNIIIYQAQDGNTTIDVKLENETLWLSLNQIAELFGRDKSVISRHIKNICKSGELDINSVVAKNATTASDGKIYQVEFYNLDMIISIGYKVNSIRGTQFRIWATKILKDHLIKGYSLNQKRLNELKQSVKLIKGVIDNYSVTTDETKALIRIISDYTYALDLLDDYDHQRVKIIRTSNKECFRLTYPEVRNIINQLKDKYKAGNLFGQEKDESIHSCINIIYQVYGDVELYPSLEEKAVNLLYFLVKNHPFIDGNKRIAAFLFIWFLDKNMALYNEDGTKIITESTLVALTLMIAESKSNEKEIINKISINLINNS